MNNFTGFVGERKMSKLINHKKIFNKKLKEIKKYFGKSVDDIRNSNYQDDIKIEMRITNLEDIFYSFIDLLERNLK